MKFVRRLFPLSLILLLGACDTPVLDPAGDVAAQQRDLLIQSTVLMLLIIVPVMAFTAWFAWHYRASNKQAKYEPEWDHSTHLELLIWSAPLLIIICLGAITWLGTHLLDPYRALGRVSSQNGMTTAAKALNVQVVALDWKWLFFYPEYGVATVNELALPVDRPIEFHITASNVMNSFYIPAMAGQIYAMPAMETQLHAVINKAGEYQGFSANYSGAGFSRMNFVVHGQMTEDFDKWIAGIKNGGGNLDRANYIELAKPTEKEPVHHYGAAEVGLYEAIVNLCVKPGEACMNSMPGMGSDKQQSETGPQHRLMDHDAMPGHDSRE